MVVPSHHIVPAESPPALLSRGGDPPPPPAVAVAVAPGDVVLFSRSCSRMDPFSALLCYSAKAGAWSHWDHVGIVVPMNEEDSRESKHPAPSSTGGCTPARLGLLEANLKGITLRPLAERLARTHSSRVAVRRLVRPSGPEADVQFLRRLTSVSNYLLQKRYTDDVLALSKALVMSHCSDVQRSRSALVAVMNIEAAAAALATELEMHFGHIGIDNGPEYVNIEPPSSDIHSVPVPAILERAHETVHLALRRRAAEASVARKLRGIEDEASDDEADISFRRLQNHSSYFCSHLVADVLAETHALHFNAGLHSHHLLPADFSSSARSPGASLWMNCGKTLTEVPLPQSNDSIPLNMPPLSHGVTSGGGRDVPILAAPPTHALSPDVVFNVSDMNIEEEGEELDASRQGGYIPVTLSSRGGYAQIATGARDEGAWMELTFSPGDVLPLTWLQLKPPTASYQTFGCQSAQEGLVEFKVISGSLHLQSPVMNLAPACLPGMSPASSGEQLTADRWVHIDRLAAPPGDGSSSDPSRLLVCAGGSGEGSEHASYFGWTNVAPAEAISTANDFDEARFAWRASSLCRLRAGGRGARVAIRLLRSSNPRTTEDSNCVLERKENDIWIHCFVRAIVTMLSSWDFESGERVATDMALGKLASFLLPHTRLVRVPAASKLGPLLLQNPNSQSLGPNGRTAMPSMPLLFLVDGTASFTSSADSGSNSSDISRLVSVKNAGQSSTTATSAPKQIGVQENEDDNKFDRCTTTFWSRNHTPRPALCLINPESLLLESAADIRSDHRHELYTIAMEPTTGSSGPGRPGASYSQGDQGSWRAKSDCLFIAIDRTASVCAGLAFGSALSDIVNILRDSSSSMSSDIAKDVNSSSTKEKEGDMSPPALQRLESQLFRSLIHERWCTIRKPFGACGGGNSSRRPAAAVSPVPHAYVTELESAASQPQEPKWGAPLRLDKYIPPSINQAVPFVLSNTRPLTSSQYHSKVASVHPSSCTAPHKSTETSTSQFVGKHMSPPSCRGLADSSSSSSESFLSAAAPHPLIARAALRFCMLAFM